MVRGKVVTVLLRWGQWVAGKEMCPGPHQRNNIQGIHRLDHPVISRHPSYRRGVIPVAPQLPVDPHHTLTLSYSDVACSEVHKAHEHLLHIHIWRSMLTALPAPGATVQWSRFIRRRDAIASALHDRLGDALKMRNG